MKILIGCLLTPLLAVVAFAAASHKVMVPVVITAPLIIEDHRIFVDAQFTRTDGTLRTARLWVDTGTPDFQITEKLAKDLGVDMSSPPIQSDDGVKQIPVHLLQVQIGGMALDLQSARPMAVPASSNVFAGSQTEGNLPATILMHYQVVLDIPRRSLTLIQAGAQRPKGKRVSCLVQPTTGMVQMEATIDGQKYTLALDSGSPYSMISRDAMKTWSAHHPDWQKITGAAGAASVLGIPRLLRAPMMRIPQIQWGALALPDVGALGMDSEFVNWYSKKTAAPVIGFLAWNVLRAFRVTIDYPHAAVYFKKLGQIDRHDIDAVGLAVTRSRSGGYAVVAVVQKDGHPTVDDVQPGDKLLKVDDRDVTKLALEKVMDALSGRPGDVHALTLDRKGTTLIVKAKVMHLI
ncbi:MAG TPA: PDZ domain-containing protein [Candidatus Angelobacter sp.]